MKQGKRKGLNSSPQPEVIISEGVFPEYTCSALEWKATSSELHNNCYHLQRQPKESELSLSVLWLTAISFYQNMKVFSSLHCTDFCLFYYFVFYCHFVFSKHLFKILWHNKVPLSLDEDRFSHTFILFKYFLLAYIKLCMDIIETPFKSYSSIYCYSHEPDQCIIFVLKLFWQYFYVFL